MLCVLWTQQECLPTSGGARRPRCKDIIFVAVVITGGAAEAAAAAATAASHAHCVRGHAGVLALQLFCLQAGRCSVSDVLPFESAA